MTVQAIPPIVFQSTLPVWGATSGSGTYLLPEALFQSTLPVWGATCGFCFAIFRRRFQSTLPVWGATCCKTGGTVCQNHFNPRSPCGERHPEAAPICFRRLYFNPRSPCGERQLNREDVRQMLNFNPRSPCGERRFDSAICKVFRQFQSTLPVWGATSMSKDEIKHDPISIHAPRVGSDSK